eukprot:RCo030643
MARVVSYVGFGVALVVLAVAIGSVGLRSLPEVKASARVTSANPSVSTEDSHLIPTIELRTLSHHRSAVGSALALQETLSGGAGDASRDLPESGLGLPPMPPRNVTWVVPAVEEVVPPSPTSFTSPIWGYVARLSAQQRYEGGAEGAAVGRFRGKARLWTLEE